MTFKVIRNAQGNVIAYGPNDNNYDPTIPLGGILSIESSIPPDSQTEQFKAIERVIEQHMDTVSQSDNWDNRWSCVARAGYVNPWQQKAIKFGQWMDQCWQQVIQGQSDVIAGTRTMPTPEQAIAELPVMVW